MKSMTIRSRIIKTAIKHFSERGYYRTTIDDIARSARCTEACIHELFSTKSDLFMAVLHAADAERTCGKSMVDVMRSNPDMPQAAREVVAFLCRVMDKTYSRLRVYAYLERPDIMQSVFRHTMEPYSAALAARLRAERARGNLRPDVDVDSAVAVLLFACAFRSVFNHLEGDFDGISMNRRDASDFVDVWLNGVTLK